MRILMRRSLFALAMVIFPCFALGREGGNLLEDPSFELTKDKDQFGLVFAKWGGWNYEGDCEFRVGRVAHGGTHSCLLFGGSTTKIRIAQNVALEPGRYRITAYVRGLEIGTGTYGMSTEFMFDGNYLPLGKKGTFGWTRLTYVAEIKEKKQTGPSFGLMAPGYFWIDDVSLEKVGRDVPLTEKPVLGTEEASIAPPGEIPAEAARCPECGYRNGAWKTCFACGTPLGTGSAAIRPVPPVRSIATFEDANPFSGGVVVEAGAPEGRKALRIDRSYVSLDRPQDWLGYDFLKAELFSVAPAPMDFFVEIRDTGTRDYWTRVNYATVVPPGRSTLIIPVKQLYVGEKARPGRMLSLGKITRLVFGIADTPAGSLLLDNVRLERDDSAARVGFAGLHAFDFGPSASPVMDGFTPITPATQYSPGRGYGLKDARIWRAFDALQPDPLYQDFICIEGGGLAVDVPNGRYRVFVNIDSPSGFWGEYQTYRRRAILAEGRPVVSETMDFESLKAKYFRFWDVEDRPGDVTFDKYQKTYFTEKRFDVTVTDGQLNLEFQGESWACSVSAVVIFPIADAARGEAFLDHVQAKRRFYFDNYFKRVLHRPTGDSLRISDDDRRRGYVVFQGDFMRDVYHNDTPFEAERGNPLRGEAFAGEYEPVTLGLVPLRDLGKVAVEVSDLTGPGGRIPSRAIELGFVSNRISRVTMEGTVYTISPRLIMPGGVADVPEGLTRRFWMTVHTPADARSGVYKGTVTIRPAKGAPAEIPMEFRVRAGTLDPVDIPAGPFGFAVGIPWHDDDPQAARFNEQLTAKSLRKMREYGFTAFSGLPTISYKGFHDGKPVLDFRAADAQMKQIQEMGFLAVVTYGGGVSGIDPYFQDTSQMAVAGFKDYAAFIKAVYSEVQAHARRNHWIPVYFNIGDEPVGETVVRSSENAEAYRKAFPQGPPYFTAASSFSGSDRQDPHFRLSRALHVADWNDHDEASVNLLHQVGGDWAFYNGGNRWTYGTYLYKAAKQFGLKFRLAWHWNVVAGDPYYALDCREDDYAWCNASPDGRLIPSVEFERLREGLDDYRRLLTLARLAAENPGKPAARAARELIDRRLTAFHLGQRDHDALFPVDDWGQIRRRLDDAIEALRK
jgi:hypothetical protein